MCFVCCATIRWKFGKREAAAYQHKHACRVDLWCVLFGVALALFAVGDALLMAHDVEEIEDHHDGDESPKAKKLGIGGISIFAAGQLTILIAMCFPREHGDPPQAFSGLLALLYVTIGTVLWIATGFGASSVCHTISTGTAVLLATYALLDLAVAWRSVDVILQTAQLGSIHVSVGAHLFLLSDIVIGLRLACEVPHDLSVYYPVVMSLYYVAILLEAYGVTKYALGDPVQGGGLDYYEA